MSTRQLSVGHVLHLIRSEYLEIPGLHLTRPQVERLWGLDAVTSDALLAALVDVQFLRQTRAGAYVRAQHSDEARHVLSDRDRGYRAASV